MPSLESPILHGVVLLGLAAINVRGYWSLLTSPGCTVYKQPMLMCSKVCARIQDCPLVRKNTKLAVRFFINETRHAYIRAYCAQVGDDLSSHFAEASSFASRLRQVRCLPHF
jgi:hypothetical protein